MKKLSFFISYKNVRNQNIGILCNLNKYLLTSALKTLYYALIHLFFFHRIIIWDPAPNPFPQN